MFPGRCANANRKMTPRDNPKLTPLCRLDFDKLFIAWAEDKALLESNLSAAAGGHTERQGTLPCLFLSCLSGGLQSDKLRGCGGGAPTGICFG
jgi:hypothetical protein